MGDTSGSDDDKNMLVPAEGSQEAAKVGPEANASTTPGDQPTSAAVSSASSVKDSNEVEKNTEEQQVEMPPTANNSTQSEEGSNPSSQNVTQQPNHREASQYVSLSANPSRDDGSASTNTSHSSLLKDFLENFLSQETDVEAATGTSMPADSMHIRGDGQVEISQHDDAGNLFALEAGNRSVVDIHHANAEGYVEGGEGRASAASLCVIKGEQDDISVLLTAAEKGLTRYDRMVLTSPLIGLGDIGFKQSTAGRLARALCTLGFSQTYIPGGGETAFGTQPFRGNAVTSDRKRYQLTVETLEGCPELAIGAPTLGWLNAACKVMESFKDPEFRARLHIPILFVACLQDKVVSLPAIEDIAVSLPSSTLVRIPGAKHEILMERDIYREQFWASFDAFLPDAQSSLEAV